MKQRKSVGLDIGIKGHMHFGSELLDQSHVSFLEKRAWEAFYRKHGGGRWEAVVYLGELTFYR